MYQYPDYLMHHGVKGMRWGVRRAKRKIRKAKRLQGYANMKKAYQKELKRYGIDHPDVVEKAKDEYEFQTENFPLSSRGLTLKYMQKVAYDDLMASAKQSQKYYEKRAKELIDKYGSEAVQ